MTKEWTSRQFGTVIDRFKPDCPVEAWDDLLIRYALLKTKGPACGSLVAKKLRGSKDIWELLGHADNHQPRLLFYFSPVKNTKLIVFVHAFMKKGKHDYPPAIALATKRRASIERGEKAANAIANFNSTVH
jgi:hypothetical protein